VTTNLARVPVLGARPPLRQSASLPTIAVAVLGAAAAAYVTVDHTALWRGLLATAIGVNLIVLGMRWPRAAALATLLFLPFLALVRRLLIADTGWIGNDPLVLVGPVVTLFLIYRLYGLEDRRFDKDVVSKLALALLALTILEAFNPLGTGGFVASLGGLIFVAIPLLWFFVGRAVGNERTVRILLYAVVGVALAVSIYGIFQTEFTSGQRLPSWDQAWYEVAGYTALDVGQAGARQIRPFSTFSSNGEYSAYLTVALMIIFALVFHRRFLLALFVPLFAFALFSSGGRSGMALSALAAVVLIGARTRKLAVGLGVVVVGIGLVYGAALAFGPRLDTAAGLSSNAVSERNVSGLLHPLDPGQSSVLARWGNFTNGVEDGFKNPAGAGTASTNIAGRNLSSDTQAGRATDNDVADVFRSLGAVGGLLYLTLIFFAFRAVFTRYSREPRWTLFAAAGVMIVMLGTWLNGGQYALAPLTWFLLGWATRPSVDPPEAEAPA
jgi:hypothetical protein